MDNTIANPTPVQVIGRASECLRRLMEAGLSYKALQVPIDDRERRENLVDFWMGGCVLPTTSQKLGREIMGKNFLGLAEAAKRFGVALSKDDERALAEVPFSEAVLRECVSTHVLVATLPLSISDIRSKVDRELFCSHEGAWYNNEAFASVKPNRAHWLLIRKTEVPGSLSKTWQDQQALLGKDEEVPTSQEVVYMTILYYLVTGERLFQNLYVRTRDVSSSGYRVDVGYFDESGLDVNGCWGDSTDGHLGCSAARKVQSS
jgi:hypothetical protein